MLYDQVNKLQQLIQHKQGDPLLFCLEVNPPRGIDLDQILHRLNDKISQLDFFNITDCALARMKCSPLPFAARLKQIYGIEPLVNVACRDRNSIALQADLLAGWMLGVRSVVALTGDAISIGDMPTAKGVFEFNSVNLLGAIQQLGEGKDLAGNDLKGHPSYISGVVVNPNAKNMGAELRRLEKKRLAGAAYALSQPVFDSQLTYEFLSEVRKSMPMPILLGLMPIKSGISGIGLSKIPGIRIPEDQVKLFHEVGTGDFSEQSILQAVSIAEQTKDLVAGFHVVSGATPSLGISLLHRLIIKHKVKL